MSAKAVLGQGLRMTNCSPNAVCASHALKGTGLAEAFVQVRVFFLLFFFLSFKIKTEQNKQEQYTGPKQCRIELYALKW